MPYAATEHAGLPEPTPKPTVPLTASETTLTPLTASETTVFACDSKTGPENGPCPVALCMSFPEECTLALEYEVSPGVDKCCPKVCNYVNADGKSCEPVENTAPTVSVTTAASALQCKNWCAPLKAAWGAKCKWVTCGGCPECSGE